MSTRKQALQSSCLSRNQWSSDGNSFKAHWSNITEISEISICITLLLSFFTSVDWQESMYVVPLRKTKKTTPLCVCVYLCLCVYVCYFYLFHRFGEIPLKTPDTRLFGHRHFLGWVALVFILPSINPCWVIYCWNQSFFIIIFASLSLYLICG